MASFPWLFLRDPQHDHCRRATRAARRTRRSQRAGRRLRHAVSTRGPRTTTAQSETTGTSDDIVQLSREVVRCTRVLRRAKSCLAHHLSSGIELPAMGLLFYLKRQGSIRQADVVAGSMLDPSTVSRQVNRLVREGLVERRPDPSDGRAVRLSVSKDGERALNSVLLKGQQYLSERLSQWDPHDVRILTELLHRFNDDLERHGP